MSINFSFGNVEHISILWNANSAIFTRLHHLFWRLLIPEYHSLESLADVPLGFALFHTLFHQCFKRSAIDEYHQSEWIDPFVLKHGLVYIYNLDQAFFLRLLYYLLCYPLWPRQESPVCNDTAEHVRPILWHRLPPFLFSLAVSIATLLPYSTYAMFQSRPASVPWIFGIIWPASSKVPIISLWKVTRKGWQKEGFQR